MSPSELPSTRNSFFATLGLRSEQKAIRGRNLIYFVAVVAALPLGGSLISASSPDQGVQRWPAPALWGECCRYPKAVVEKAVDDWVDEAVTHCQPVCAGEDGDDDATGLWLVLISQLRNKVEDDIEDVQWQPADCE